MKIYEIITLSERFLAFFFSQINIFVLCFNNLHNQTQIYWVEDEFVGGQN